jgi:hypothetical protein
MVESFNVSVSAAVALWELTQRRRRYLGADGDLDDAEAVELALRYLKRALKSRELVAHLEAEHGAFLPLGGDARAS